jgi:hypothetical protein
MMLPFLHREVLPTRHKGTNQFHHYPERKTVDSGYIPKRNLILQVFITFH